MTLSVPLSPAVEAALRQRAAATGEDPATVASELLSRALSEPGRLSVEGLEAISGKTCQEFVASGMTDAQLGDELEQIKHVARAARRGIAYHE
jgi:hypothetical protein